uniref:Uncharacterized protein n=1 Tax=Trichuris muris TaxID=70415 RepID=A0A5S6R2Q1_TRIMR
MCSLSIPLIITVCVLQSAIANPVYKQSEGLARKYDEPLADGPEQLRVKRFYGFHSWLYPGSSYWGYYPSYYRRTYYYPLYAWGK